MRNILRRLLGKKNKNTTPITKQQIKNFVDKEDAVIIEIGAANGDDSFEFLQTFTNPNFRLYAVEPEPKNIKILLDRIRDNRFTLFEGVLSDKNGLLTFNRSRTDNPNDLSFSGSIMNPKNHLTMWDWIHFDQTIQVPSKTLDDFLSEKNITIVDFIWCDVQGAEALVIKGGDNAFKQRVRYFYTEYSNNEQYEGQPTLAQIKALLPHFEVVNDYGSDVLLKNTLL